MMEVLSVAGLYLLTAVLLGSMLAVFALQRVFTGHIAIEMGPDDSGFLLFY